MWNPDDERLVGGDENETRTHQTGRSPFRISVEITLFLAVFAMSLTGAAISNILLYRTCVHSLSHSEAECEVFLSPIKSNDTTQLESEVQKYTTFVSTVKMVLEAIVPAIMSFFLGAWSDTYGRKPLMVWPLFGMSLTAMLTVVYGMMPSLGPWWYILTIVPFSLTGGYVVLFTGAYCYVSDITSVDNTSLRMTLVDSMVLVGGVTGSIASTYLILSIGNVYLLLIAAAVMVLAYAYTNIYVKESLSGALQGGTWRVLDLLLVKEMINECFKKRPNHGRAQILSLVAVRGLATFVMYGTMGLDYMFCRKKLQWSLKDYTSYSAVNAVIGFTGGFLGVIVVQKLLGVKDIPLAFIALLSATAEFMVKVFASLSWHLYLGAAISPFKGLIGALIRSYMSKVLPVEDIAKVFALTCAVEGISPIVSPVIFNSLYEVTLSSFPAAIYVLSVCINVICLILLGLVLYYSCIRPASYSTLIEDSGEHA